MKEPTFQQVVSVCAPANCGTGFYFLESPEGRTSGLFFGYALGIEICHGMKSMAEGEQRVGYHPVNTFH